MLPSLTLTVVKLDLKLAAGATMGLLVACGRVPSTASSASEAAQPPAKTSVSESERRRETRSRPSAAPEGNHAEASAGESAKAGHQPETPANTDPEGVGRAAQAPEFTGGEQAELIIENHFLVPQYVFLDGERLTVVPSGSRVRLEIAPGDHALSFADTPSQPERASHIAELFEAGFRYQYEVIAR